MAPRLPGRAGRLPRRRRGRACGGEAGHAVPRRILDLGAGTGQLTESLLGAGHDVVAADTSADLLAQLAVRLPGVPTFVAKAEDLPLPDGDVDVVVAAQAAHWFDPAAAGREFRRVLRSGGAVGFVWHMREESAAWAVETWHPRTRPRTLEVDADVRWTGLGVLATSGGSPLETDGTVEFRAHYVGAGRAGAQHERSRFLRERGRWFYLDGVSLS